MTEIKLCGMMEPCDIETVNELLPEYIGFIFWDKSFRYLTKEKASELKKMLNPKTKAVGVFVDAKVEIVSALVNTGIIDVIQLHGSEDEEYIARLRMMVPGETKIIKAFKVTNTADVNKAVNSTADYILFDPGKGSGNTFNWELIENVKRPYFLAGGLNLENVKDAIRHLNPYAVDVSSGIETDKHKDREKMKKFVSIVRQG